MKEMQTMRIGLYARVSSDRQVEQGTIASQLAALRQRIEADGGLVDPELEFIDDGCSGGTLLRPALERLRDQAAQGAFDRLYVHSPDRLARNFAYQVLLIEEFGRLGLQVVFLNHQLGDSPDGDLLLQVQGVIAEYERAKIRERMRRGKLHAARTGQVSALAAAPYGYRYVKKHEGGGQARYEIVPERARVVQQIFAWVARERVSLSEVCRRLQARGEPSPSGRRHWQTSTITNVLNNPAYKGTAAYGARQVVPRRPRLRPPVGKPEVARCPYSVQRSTPLAFVPVPALVSEEDFAAVAEQMAENRERYRQRRAGARHLLQGLAVCASCGYGCHGLFRGDRRRYRYYRCGGHQALGADPATRCQSRMIRAEHLEEAVWRDVRALLAHPQKIEEEYQRRLGNKPGPATARGIEPLTRVIEKVKRSIARLVDLYSEGLLEKSELEPRLKAARERLSRLEQEAQAQAAELSEQADLRLALSRLQEFAEQVQEGLENADWTTCRSVIRALVKRVEIADHEVRIVYRVAPVPFVESPIGGVLQDRTDRSSVCKSFQNGGGFDMKRLRETKRAVLK
jgi:site-specific DNA recombinase